MFATAVSIIILLIAFHIFHELGHLLFAIILKLRIKKIGFALNPLPHTYIYVYHNHTNSSLKRFLYQISGFIIFLTLLKIFIIYNLLFSNTGEVSNTFIIAFFIQFLIETNPKYSDFVIMQLEDKIKYLIKDNHYNINYADAYKKAYKEYLFSKKWYIHFTIWILSILLTYKYILL